MTFHTAKLAIVHSRFFVSNDTAHPKNGLDKVLKGDRVWFDWLTYIVFSYHNDNIEFRLFQGSGCSLQAFQGENTT